MPPGSGLRSSRYSAAPIRAQVASARGARRQRGRMKGTPPVHRASATAPEEATPADPHRDAVPGVLASVGRWLLAHPDLLVLLPLCGLLLLGIARQVMLGQTASLKFDDALFLSVGHGVLTRGYPIETVHDAAGLAFFDHTPLYSYFMALPALVDDLVGPRAALLTGRAMSAVFGLGTLIVAYLICRDVRGAL